MNLLLLAGNSLRNKEWIHEVERQLSKHFDATLVHHYRHWQTEEDFIDFDNELTTVSREATNFQPYSIFAKSVGSILSIQGIAGGEFQSQALLITGLPLRVIQEKAIPVGEWLRQVTIPVLIVQNQHDPLGSYEEVSAFISTIGNDKISVVMLPGNTHDYDDFNKLSELSAALTR
jgi:hypothetical protein